MKTIPFRLIRIAIVMLVALAWSRLAFCGEIHDAAKAGDLGKVKALLKGNPDLASSKDCTGWTPLHLAALRGFNDLTELLLANNAEVNAKDNTGHTPLHDVRAGDRTGVRQLLRLHGGRE
jgi:hypothetical protein